MRIKCIKCGHFNGPDGSNCENCSSFLFPAAPRSILFRIMIRAGICLMITFAVLLGFYLSLIWSARSLTIDEKSTVRAAIRLLRDKGFDSEVFLMNNLTAFRSDDNWLNASVEKESAYAATNFPFEIMTLYHEFFKYPVDDVERAAILLHEARHLKGDEEREAYEFVWKNRERLGWTSDKYRDSLVWRNVRTQTKDAVPELFICTTNEFNDCTEPIVRR